MNKIFISGSINIKNINPNVIDRINNMIASNFSILVGDAKGSDSSIQNILKDKNFKGIVKDIKERIETGSRFADSLKEYPQCFDFRHIRTIFRLNI